MIETVQATADTGLVGDPWDLLEQVAADQPGGSLWRRIGRDSVRLAGDASGLGSLVVRRGLYNGGTVQIAAEGNLTSLLYGKEGKALGLAATDLGASLDRLVGEAVRCLPSLAPRTAAAWRVSRVDASVTWALQPRDAQPVFDFMRDAFFTLHSGRVQASQPGPRSLMLRRTKEDSVRLYSKTDEANAKGSPLPAGLSEDRATLVRLESQIVARTARRVYGDNLADLAAEGINVASRTLADWLDTFGATATGKGAREVFTRLVLGGISADRAMCLVGPAMMLRSGGVDALVRDGVPRSTAYRWKREIEAAVPDHVWREELGIPLALEDAVTADQFCDRIA
jgi:hypothetical protein